MAISMKKMTGRAFSVVECVLKAIAIVVLIVGGCTLLYGCGCSAPPGVRLPIEKVRVWKMDDGRTVIWATFDNKEIERRGLPHAVDPEDFLDEEAEDDMERKRE